MHDKLQHTKVAELLPWHVNGTLSGDEEALVKAHIDDCAECRTDVAFLRSVQDGVMDDAAAPLVPTVDVDTVLARRSTERAGQSSFATMPRLAIAATVLLAIAAAVLFGLNPSTTNQRFDTATTGSSVEHLDYVLHLQFAVTATPQRKLEVIESLQPAAVMKSEETDEYRLTVSMPLMSITELEDYSLSVQEMPGVRSARIVALQLPVRGTDSQ